MKVTRLIVLDKNVKKLGDLDPGQIFEWIDGSRQLSMKLFSEKNDCVQFASLGTGVIDMAYKCATVRLITGSFVEEEFKND